MIAIDTNLLVYAHRSGTPEHPAACRVLERACADNRGWGISWPCLTEFWSIVTHPACAGRPSTPQEAMGFIRILRQEGNARVWLPSEEFPERFQQLAVNLKISGPRIFDLQIGLVALENGAEVIWTHDRNFLPIPGIRIEDPL